MEIVRKNNSKKANTKQKSKKLFNLEKGTLKKFGYNDVKSMSKQKRRQSLKKAITNMKPLSVMRKLIAVSTLQKNINPEVSKIMKEDASWIKTTKEYKKRSKL